MTLSGAWTPANMRVPVSTQFRGMRVWRISGRETSVKIGEVFLLPNLIPFSVLRSTPAGSADCRSAADSHRRRPWRLKNTIMVYSHLKVHCVYETAFRRRNGAACQQNARPRARFHSFRIRNDAVSYTGIRFAIRMRTG
jgi:hypothetical protein